MKRKEVPKRDVRRQIFPRKKPKETESKKGQQVPVIDSPFCHETLQPTCSQRPMSISRFDTFPMTSFVRSVT